MKILLSFLSQAIGKGLAVTLPIIIAAYVIVWVIRDSDRIVRSALVSVLPEETFLPPGLGILLFFLITLLAGLLMYPWITRRALLGVDSTFRRIPFFRSVYSPVKDFFDLFDKNVSEELSAVVMIKVPGTEMETLGFVTKRDNEGLPEGFLPEGHLAVYVQWSSQIGGYCFIVPEASVRYVNLTVEQGMRWSLTAGLSSPYSNNSQTAST
jgi:uncharacterized membrane protein